MRFPWLSRVVGGLEARLSALIGTLLARYLGDFLSGFQPGDIRIRLRGDVEIANVKISKQALAFLDGILPWQYESLSISRLKLHLPIFNLLEEVAQVEIDGVDVVFVADDFSAARSIVRPKEPFAPQLRTLPPPLPPPDPIAILAAKFADCHPSSAFIRLLTVLAERFRVCLRDVRISIVDKLTNPAHPHQLSLQFQLAKLGAVDDLGVELAHDQVAYRPTLQFALQVENMGVFLQTPPITSSEEDYVIRHEGAIVVRAGLRLGSSADHEEMGIDCAAASFVTVTIAMQEFALAIGNEKMAFVWDLLHRISWWNRRWQVKWLRPVGRVQDGPDRWWRFGRSVLNEELNARLALLRCTTWSCVILAAQRRRRYIRLYRKHMDKTRVLTAEDCIELEQLDFGFDPECIRHYRAVAERNLPRDLSFVEKLRQFIEKCTPSRAPSKEKSGDDDDDDLPSTCSKESDDDEALLGSYQFSLHTASFKLLLTNRQAPAPLLDLTLTNITASFFTNSAFSKLSADVSLGLLQSVEEPRALCIMSAPSPLEVHLYLHFSQSCTHMGIGCRLAQTTAYVPGAFIDAILKWLSFTTMPVFYLIPPTLFQEEIAEVQYDAVHRSYVPAFRMAIDARLGPLTLVAHTGESNGPELNVCLGQFVAKCTDAKKEEVDLVKFPEFDKALTRPGQRNVYDYYRVCIENISISFSENALLFASPASKLLSTALNFLRSDTIEAAILLLTMPVSKLPFILAELNLPPIKLSVSATLYRVILRVLTTFAVEPTIIADIAQVDTILAAEAAFTAEENTKRSHAAAPYIGSRVLIQASSTELVLSDRFSKDLLSVWRVRATAFRFQSVVKADALMRTSVRVQVESWYLNHVVHAWEPMIEPWTLALMHSFDGITSHDISLKGDIRPLNVTLSSALAENLVHVAQTFDFLPAPRQAWKPANIIINETGIAITVTSSFPAINERVAPNDQFLIPVSHSSSHRYVQLPQVQVQLKDWPGSGPPLRVQYSQPCVAENGLIAATVTTTFGYVTIRIHSLVQFKNATGHALDLAMESTGGETFFESRLIMPGDGLHLPLQIVNKGRIMVRLHDRQVGFCMPIDILPVHRMTSGIFDLVLKSEAGNIEAGVAPVRSDSVVFAVEKNASLRLLGHQHIHGKQLLISVSPVLIVDNLLFSKCDLRITGTNGNFIDVRDVKCGDRVECFINESEVTIGVALPGCVSSEPLSIGQKARAGVTALFKNNEPERKSIGIPTNEKEQAQSIYQNFISYETEYQQGSCPVVRLFAPFWIVNHTPKPLYFICGPTKEIHSSNLIPTYPAVSCHGVPMLMAGCEDMQNTMIWLKTATTNHSDSIPLCKLESGISVTLKDSDGTEYEMRLKITRASGRFSRTKIVFVMPQLVIVNCLNQAIYLRQNAHDSIVEIKPKSRLLDYVAPNLEHDHLMRISLIPSLPSGWSGLFAFNVLGHNSLLVPKTLNADDKGIIECIIKQRDNIVYAVFRHGDARFPPCQIDNQSRFSMEFSQAGLNSWNPIPPFSTVPFCWMEPLMPLGLDARFEGSPDTMQSFNMESPDDSLFSEWRTAKGNVLVQITQTESPMKTLRLIESSVSQNGSGVSNGELTPLIEKSATILESCIKFAEKQYKKESNMVDSMRTRPSKLYITVIEAWDLPRVDKNGLIDAYVEILAGESKDRTPIQKKQLNPHFHYSTVVQVRDGISDIVFRVVDYNVVKDQVIGGFIIPLSTLADEQRRDAWYKIYKMKEKEPTKAREQGQVRVILQWIRTSESMKTMLRCDLEKSVAQYRHHLTCLNNVKERVLAESRRERASVITSTREGIHRLLNKRRSLLPPAPIIFAKASKQRILSGRFRIGVISARNCLDMDSGGTSDPYCKISYGAQAHQTKVVKKTINPDWDESFEFEYERLPSNHGHFLRIAIFDQDQASEDDFMGEVILIVNDYIEVPAKNVVQEWHQILSMNKYADDLFRAELGESAITRGDVLIQFEWIEITVERYDLNAGFEISIPSLGISVVDSGYQRELMFLSLNEIDADCEIEEGWKDFSLSLSVGSAQIDNPDVNSGGGETSQMVLLGLVRKADDPLQPMIQFVMQSRHSSDLFDYFPYVNLLILGVAIHINTKWLSNFLWLAQHLVDLVFAGYREPLPPLLPVDGVPVVGQESGRKVFFGMMILSPLSVTITLRNGISSGVVQRRTDYDWILRLASSVALDGCLVNLNALGLANYVSNYDDLLNLVIMHYVKNAATAAFSVLGSSDVLGNPVQLVSGLGSGVKDFFFEPAAGFALGPAAFGRGLLKGSAALLSGTVGGVLNSASKVTGNLGNLAAAITMDAEYKAKARQQQLQLNAVDGTGLQAIATGGAAFSRGIFSGVTGVLVDPFKGAKQDGVKGLVKGIGKGLVGAVTKPISGTLQLASAAAGGVRNATSTYNRNNHRRLMLARFPRHFYGMQRRIKVYSATFSKGKFLLDVVHRSKYRTDDFIDVLDLPDNRSLVLSSKRLLLVSVNPREAIIHTLAIDQIWVAAIDQLKAESRDDKFLFEQNGEKWEVNLSQVPPQQVNAFYKKIVDMISFNEDGSIEQKYWILTENDEMPGGWPCSPLAHPQHAAVTRESSQDEADEAEILDAELARLKTGLSAAVHTGTTLEVIVYRATGLILKRRVKIYCKVCIQTQPRAKHLLRQASLQQTEDTQDDALESECQSELVDDQNPFWGLSCKFPMDNVDSDQLVIKVFGKRIGKDKLIGQAICDLGGFSLEKQEVRILPLLKTKKGIDIIRGSIEIALKLCNPHVLSLQAQMEVARHKMLRAVKKAVVTQHFITELQHLDQSIYNSETERSETVDLSENEHSQTAFDDEDVEELEDSLRRQYRTLSDQSYLREASLCDLNAMVQFEIIRARNFKMWSRKKPPAMRATIMFGEVRFRSLPMESWEPNWNMRFVIKMPQSSRLVNIKVQKKTFLGAKTVGKLHIEFESLVARASVSEGVWIGLNTDGDERRTDIEVELLVRIQIKSQVLEELIGAENAVADELHLRS